VILQHFSFFQFIHILSLGIFRILCFNHFEARISRWGKGLLRLRDRNKIGGGNIEMADAAAELDEGGVVRTLKDLFAGAAGGIAQVLLGAFGAQFCFYFHNHFSVNCAI
jgi:hypothetical protein